MNVAKMLRNAGLHEPAGPSNLLNPKHAEGHQTRWFGRTSTPLVKLNKNNGLCCEKSTDKAGTNPECCEARASDFQSAATPATSATWPSAERQTDPGGSSTWTEVVKPMEAASERRE